MKFSICLPTYKGDHVIGMALESIFNQSYQNFEILIGDDNPPNEPEYRQRTRDVIEKFDCTRIKYFANDCNLGYPLNLKKLVESATGDIIYLFAQDDILAKGAFHKTYEAFQNHPDVGVVTRSFFQFMGDIKHPVRAWTPPNNHADMVCYLEDDELFFQKVMASIAQLSGLAYRRSLLEVEFHEDVFPAHIYPFVGICRKHKCLFLKDYLVAVEIEFSQSRHVPGIYTKSALKSWLNMFDTVFGEPEYEKLRKWGYKFACKNFVGLVQIRNYANSNKELWREISLLVKYYPKNLLDPRFWFFSLGTLLTPRVLLRKLVDYYKYAIHSRLIPNISFESAFLSKELNKLR